MDILKAEIERKRKQLQNNDLLVPNKKYFKRSTLLIKQEEDYWKKYQSKYQDFHHDSKISKNDSNDKQVTLNPEDDPNSEKYTLSRKEVIRRLRDRCEPVRLFGETDYDSFQRLRRLEILEPEVNKGLRNDFQDAMEKVDQEYLNELIKAQGSNGENSNNHDVKVQDDGTTMEDINKLATKFRQDDTSLDIEVIMKFLKFLLQLWGTELNNRSESDKQSVRGKLASVTHTQTQAYLKPLFRKLKSKTIQEDILEHLCLIVDNLLKRDYIKASDAYLQMAIGNAPWPIGVTMVGIHARTGREKIFAQHVAHVLNDETQRKYIQGVKRLMTQCQRFFPTDPSKSIEYNAF